MELFVAVLLGLLISFVGSIPIAGPLAVLVLDRATSGRRVEGLFIALGGAVSEAAYAFGVAALFPLLLATSHSVVFISRVAGAVLIAGAGLVLFAKPDVIKRTPGGRRSGSFLTGLALSGLNPTLIATWTVVVATLNSHDLLRRTTGAAAFFGLGVGAGVTGWFALLVWLSGPAERFLGGKRRTQVLRGLGLMLFLIGGYLVFKSFYSARSAA